MKLTLLWLIMAIVAIVVISSFGLQIAPIVPAAAPASVGIDNALYVCPVADSVWDSVAFALSPIRPYIIVAIFFAIMVLAFSWGWALYQNLMEDKFKDAPYKNVWEYTKVTFWCFVILILLVYTPNHFRSVRVDGRPGQWVLCESTSPDAIPVSATSVKH